MLVYVDLIQDIDVLLPVILALREERLPTEVRVARWLARASPRTALLLRDHQIPFGWVSRKAVVTRSAPSLKGVSTLLTTSESTATTHTACHRLAARAIAAGAATFTLQHGLENPGLQSGTDGQFEYFNSTNVFCWSPAAQSNPQLPIETAEKLIRVGRPVIQASTNVTEPDVLVFENLHADHYSETDRAEFMMGLDNLLTHSRALSIGVRSHPAGGWIDEWAPRLRRAGATVTTSREARTARLSGREAAASARKVITPPSTIALDAAVARREPALALAGGDLYEPLPVLRAPADWSAFAFARVNPEPGDAFRDRNLLPLDAARLIARHLAEAASG